MRSALIWYGDQKAGILEETDEGYRFRYAPLYVQAGGPPVSQTLPVRDIPYDSKTLFPFFDGLIPEGWLLDLGARNWKLDTRDRFGLLLAFCRDPIGAVGVEAHE